MGRIEKENKPTEGKEMKITIKWLCSKDACQDGQTWFKKQKETEAVKIIAALMPDKFEWANWLITRILSRRQNIDYAIHAASLVLHLYEDKYPGSDAPRNAINAARAVLACDTPTTRAAAKAAAAAYTAARAAPSAASNARAAAAAAYSAAYGAADSDASMKANIIWFGLELMG